MSLNGGDVLARGGRRANFYTGSAEGDTVELKNLSTEPREEIDPATLPTKVEIKKRTVRPLGDQLLIRRKEAEDFTASGILIVEQAKERPAEGLVLAIGPGVKDVLVNDIVLFGKYAGQETPINGEVILLMREEEVLAKVYDQE